MDIFFLTASEMRSLEKRCGIAKPGHVPNVISFREPEGFPHPERRGRIVGEVYLNKELSKSKQRRAEVLGNYLTFLLIHGILHITGYSHSQKHDRLAMESLEDRMLKKIFKR